MARNTDGVYTGFYANHLKGGMKNNPAINQQGRTEQMYIRILTELCCNRFKWEGLPESISERFLELNLFWRVLSVFYFDKDYNKYLALQGSGVGAPNMHDDPTKFVVTAPMIHKTLRAVPDMDPDTKETLPAECVPIWANYMRVPDLDIVMIYAKRLATIDRTIEIDAMNMRYTKQVAADENTRLSYVNAMRQHVEGQPFIFTTNSMDLNSAVNVLDMGMPSGVLSEAMIARSRIWNECMGLLGINNANQDKKERLVADEVAANDEQVSATRAISMNSRQQACERINAMFPDLTVSVRFVDEPSPEEIAAGSDADSENETNKVDEKTNAKDDK